MKAVPPYYKFKGL